MKIIALHRYVRGGGADVQNVDICFLFFYSHIKWLGLTNYNIDRIWLGVVID